MYMLDSFYLALGFRARLKGFLFTQPHAGLLILCPCNCVHTFGMKYALDIAFVDEAGVVLASFRDVKSLRVLRKKKAKVVLERFSCNDSWFVEGERILLGTDNFEEEGEVI